MVVTTQSQPESRELEPELVRRVLDAVDSNRDGLVAFLQRLLAFRTESPNPEASHFLDEADACRAFLVSDEQVVGFGSRECVAQLPTVDAAIDPEPSNMAITPATGGLEHLRIEVQGLSAHAGVRYRSVHAGGGRVGGVNAIEKMVKLLVGLQELERERDNT